MLKNPPANAEDVGSIPGLGRSPREGHGNPASVVLPGKSLTGEPGRLQSKGLEKSQTRLSY